MSEVKTTAEVLEPLENQLARLASGFPLTPERQAEIDAHQQKTHETAKSRNTEALRANWGAPVRHADSTPQPTGEWGQKLNVIRGQLGARKGLLISLVGGRGNGKTQLAVELMKDRTAKGKSALFTTAIQFFMAIKATYKADSKESEDDVLHRFHRPSLLVIDEIGKRGQTDWENNLLFELLNSRYNDMRDTVLIDNRTKPEFIEAIGPSLASRMNEGGGIIECNWKSFRE